MHFTETVYRNPYWPTFPLLQITQGCTHNSCKFCTMYRNVSFKVQPMEWIEEDLRELSTLVPDATTIQLLSANPLCMTYDKLAPILEKINRYLPKMEYIYAATRVTDIQNKTVEQLKALKEMGMREISLGVESGDDWTLDRVNKGYHASDIVEQCGKLTDACNSEGIYLSRGAQRTVALKVAVQLTFVQRGVQFVVRLYEMVHSHSHISGFLQQLRRCLEHRLFCLNRWQTVLLQNELLLFQPRNVRIAECHQSVGLEGNGALYSLSETFDCLVGQSVQKIEVNVGLGIAQQSEYLFHRFERRTAVHRLQYLLVKVLHADAEPCESCINQIAPVVKRQVSGVTFYGNFGLLNRAERACQMFVKFLYRLGWHCRRTTSAVVNLRDATVFVDIRQQKVYFLVKCVDISFNLCSVAHGIRVARAVVAQMLAERHVQVERQVAVFVFVRESYCIDILSLSQRAEIVCRRITCISWYWNIVFVDYILSHLFF